MKALFLAIALMLSSHAEAKDYSNSPNHDWFQRQKTPGGMPCCDVADGKRLDDADWKSDSDGHYWVKLDDGEFHKVPDNAIINPKDRPIDYAVVWVYKGNIWCFLVGSGM